MSRPLLPLLCILAAATLAPAAPARADFAPELLRDVFPGAIRMGPIEGNPPAAAVFDDAKAIGFVFSSRDVIGSLGYSGKPLDVAVGMTRGGKIAGARLLHHEEPILVLGIADSALHDFVASHRGLDIRAPVGVRSTPLGRAGADTIAGATVTALLLREAILRSSRAVARSRGMLGGKVASARVDLDRFEPRDWDALRAEGAVAQLRLMGADVTRRLGPEAGLAPDVLFIDLVAALATPAGIGRNLLGDAAYNALVGSLGEGEQAVLIGGSGLYSFKGTSFVRTGTFDRVRIVQGEATFHLATAGHRRVQSLTPGTPEFREIGLFALPADSGFDPTAPWQIELLVARPAGDDTRPPAVFALEYRIPARFLRAASEPGVDGMPLWEEIWRDRIVSVAICSAVLVLLMAMLVAQDRFARHPVAYRRVRLAFIAFTLVWIGWYALAQLSVVNILTFVQALLTGFRWEFFLLEPVVFLLWSFVAVALLFWGRGVFCGWLCPFGAMQDFAHRLGRWLKLPAWRLNFVLHERLAALKYVIFLAILGLSLNFMREALAVAEIEPFKTAITLKFARPWPFVVYALALFAVGLVLERAFCRYLCPLGAGLAIPARLRLFEWLKRKKQCGTECQICASRCPVQAIHPDGRINPNECIHCLNCQLLYYDAETCPPLIARRQRRAARQLQPMRPPVAEASP
jgi:transcriptional regulator of nitric oxide reductase